jgi:hypothetical protein
MALQPEDVTPEQMIEAIGFVEDGITRGNLMEPHVTAIAKLLDEQIALFESTSNPITAEQRPGILVKLRFIRAAIGLAEHYIVTVRKLDDGMTKENIKEIASRLNDDPLNPQ